MAREGLPIGCWRERASTFRHGGASGWTLHGRVVTFYQL